MNICIPSHKNIRSKRDLEQTQYLSILTGISSVFSHVCQPSPPSIRQSAKRHYMTKLI